MRATFAIQPNLSAVQRRNHVSNCDFRDISCRTCDMISPDPIKVNQSFVDFWHMKVFYFERFLIFSALQILIDSSVFWVF